MLFYIKIGPFEGVDYTKGKDYIDSSTLESRECSCCNFYFYHKMNFHYLDYVCNGCFQCQQHEKMNPPMLFRVVKTRKGIFRTVDNEFLIDIEKALERRATTIDLGGYTWTDYAVEYKIGFPYGIEPPSLNYECPAIGP